MQSYLRKVVQCYLPITLGLNYFQNNKKEYLDSIDRWIEQIIIEVYAERNLETHNNISSDLSLIKLKDSFLYISQIILNVSMEFCKNKPNSIDDVMKFI